jgi:hypothetical protein
VKVLGNVKTLGYVPVSPNCSRPAVPVYRFKNEAMEDKFKILFFMDE